MIYMYQGKGVYFLFCKDANKEQGGEKTQGGG
jgi:hypothetical protein